MNTGETIALIKAFGNGGGGSSLPAVTSADNGKVLAVKDEAWAADSNAFIVTISGNTCSHSSAEIKAVVDSGRPVFAFDANGTFFVLTQSVDNIATFVSIFGVSNTIQKRTVSPQKAVTSYNSAFVPGVSVSEDGFELVGKNGSWAKQAKKFIVTLTPTALDYSGTMDKTVAEIKAAYEAGQEIWLKLEVAGMGYLMERASLGNGSPADTYPSFNAYFIEKSSHMMLYVYTGYTSIGTDQTYGATIYSLTPAS